MTPPYDGVYFNSLNNNLSYYGHNKRAAGWRLFLELRIDKLRRIKADTIGTEDQDQHQ